MEETRALQRSHNDGTVETLVVGGRTVLEAATIEILSAVLSSGDFASTIVRESQQEERSEEDVKEAVDNYRRLSREVAMIARIALYEARLADPLLPRRQEDQETEEQPEEEQPETDASPIVTE